MFSWLIDQVSPWVWLVMGLVASGLVFYFLSPILIPLWAVTPKPVKIALGFVVSLVFAVLYGRHKGAKDAEALQKAREQHAVETRRKVDASVSSATDDDLHRRASRWLRDDD